MTLALPYTEGTWFAVPLRNGKFAPGLVARATKKGKVILCYFFPSLPAMPKLDEVKDLSSDRPVLVARAGDLGLINRSWPVLGEANPWKRENWLVPVFVRREPLGGRTFLVYRSDYDPNEIVREESVSPSLVERDIREDSVFGHGAIENILT